MICQVIDKVLRKSTSIMIIISNVLQALVEVLQIHLREVSYHHKMINMKMLRKRLENSKNRNFLKKPKTIEANLYLKIPKVS